MNDEPFIDTNGRLAVEIVQRRTDQQMSVATLAQRAQTSEELVRRLEAGDGTWKIEAVWRILRALGAKPKALPAPAPAPWEEGHDE
ncbi:helix-turn-helix domain-containing protein [Schaalia suimastitidis]|uniref:helix-turn-helix domain-containing protein n=1 Tax=Schaalia suimastitidis TaxID=121163 RepID=UPI00041632E3|nr:hypothetical protein [Schaalia suimastitidis]